MEQDSSGLTAIIVVGPSHQVNAQLAIAANRAAETGIVDLGYGIDARLQRTEIDSLRRHARHQSRWGARWDGLDVPARGLDALQSILGEQPLPILVLSGVGSGELELAHIIRKRQSLAEKLILEVTSLEEGERAQEAGFDGVIIKGFEASGNISPETIFCLLQRFSRRLRIPFWAQGGIGPDTAASALLAGAAGIVLAEQVWMAHESPIRETLRSSVSSVSCLETLTVGDGDRTYRFLGGPDRSRVREIDRELASGGDWRSRLVQMITSGALVPAGQDICLADRLATRHINVAGIIAAYRLRSQENFKMACRGEVFAPAAALAESHGTKFPLLQGPIAGVTDEPEFCGLVEKNGALPFVSLGWMDVDEARRRLDLVKGVMGRRPWGAALANLTEGTLRDRHFELIAEAKPPFAMVDGRDRAKAERLEELGVTTYMHVDSPEILEELLAKGRRRFVFEGSDCGGPLGPRSTFSLWQCAIDVLLTTKIDRVEDLHLIFAGPIHDALSSAMTSAAIAPLSAKGMKVGAQIGSAHFFTTEAVAGGVVTEEFHRTILNCRQTAILFPGDDPGVRCVPTPFVDEFNGKRASLMRSGASREEIRHQLQTLAQKRLTLAAKGLLDDRPAELEAQKVHGLFRVGDVAVLRDQAITLRELYEGICQEGVVLLERLASERLPWRRAPRPRRTKSEDIAIVGMACMFPQAEDLRRYWENICRGIDAIEEVSPDRWSAEDFYHSNRLERDRVYSKWGGFIGKIVFDPMKWRIPPASLKAIEPIQLLALEVASRAMADAGYDRREFPRERTGVLFACAGSHDVGSSYAFRTMMHHYLPRVEGLTSEAREQIEESLGRQLPEWTEDSFPGFLMNVVAGRIARELNVNGPNYTVDAACAAALAAFHAAIEQLRSGTSDMMIVGGADATNNPFCYMSFSKTHALSPRGRSRPFDESGDGIALGEGIGVVILKRLKDAERDGDKIYAVIKGIGSSSDGKNKSLTAPHPPGQIKAVERAYDDADVSPTTISLVEAHGTGTVVGDSAEITTLNEVFSSRTDEKQFVAVGSVKSMIGHTKTVAGMASMIKTALALKNKVLPPTIGVENPTSRFDFESSPFYISAETRPWIEDLGEHPRRAGVSAFGFGGTNFHVVLEEYAGDFLPGKDECLTPRSAEIFTFTGQNAADLQEKLAAVQTQSAGMPDSCLAPLAARYDLERNGSATAPHRLAIVATSVGDLHKKSARAIELLQGKDTFIDPNGIFASNEAPKEQKQVCFLYPGQGSQTLNMLRDPLTGSPWGQELFSKANVHLSDFLPRPLSRYIYPPPFFDEAARKEAFAALSDTRVAQPALGVVELFATELLHRFGVHPGMVAGHSYGEHVALYAAGVLSRDELMWLSAMRGQVCADIAAQSPGGMAAVQASAADVQRMGDELELNIYLANMNAPDQTIIAGSEADIDIAVSKIAATGVRAKRIPVSAPFHTPLLEAGSHAMAEHFARAHFAPPRIPVYSNTTGKRHSHDPRAIRDLLTRHFSEPVHFEEEIREIHADGGRIFIEVGPGKVLTELTSRILKDASIDTVALDVAGRDGWVQFGHAIARLFVLGLPIRTSAWFEGRGLAEGDLKHIFEKAERLLHPKKSDWILGPTGCEPVAGPARPSTAPLISKIGLIKDEKTFSSPSPLVESPISGKPDVVPHRSATPIASSGPAAVTPAMQARTGDHLASTPVSVPSAAPSPVAQAHVPSGRGGIGSGRALVRRPSSLVRQERPRLRPPTRAISRTNTPMNVPNTSHHEVVPSNGAVPASGADMYFEVQASTRMFLEFQQSQQLLMERFLETQERLLSLCLGHRPQVAAPPAIVPAVQAPIPIAPAYSNGHVATPAAPAAVPVPPVVATAPPVSRPPIAVPSARGPAVAVAPPAITAAAPPRPIEVKAAPSPQSAAPVRAAAPPAPAPSPVAAASSDGPPPVSQFRKDLLAVISERTGYPEDMLDEELPLEAGLGIDSIKTVEIFSTLKQYHKFMRDEDRDEEEALAEFTTLKTIKDILNSYEKRIAKYAGGGAPEDGSARATNAKSGSVERHSLAAAEAPLSESGSKKNSLASI